MVIKNQLLRRWVFFVLIVLLASGVYWLFNQFYVYSSDAYVSGQIYSISSQVQGQIDEVLVSEGQHVQADDILLHLDPKPYRYVVEQLQATLKTQEDNYQNILMQIEAAKQTLKVAQIDEMHAKQQWKKKSQLAGKALSVEAVKLTRYNYDRAQAATLQAQASLLALVRGKAKVGPLKAKVGPEGTPFAAIVQARAALKQAQYALQKTEIRAPVAGTVSNIHLSIGDNVNKGVPLFALVSAKQRWLVARIKESYLPHIKLGDLVSIYLETGGPTLHGHVTSLGAGVNRRQASGEVVSSPLPYLERTEDWISLEQRFPVYVTLDDAPLDLALGLSASMLVHR